VRTAVVCLPTETVVADLAPRATAIVTGSGLHAAGVLPHFPTHTRRARRLIDRWCGRTSGGPIGLLDLDGMRRAALTAAADEWAVWDTVVKGTRPAQPYWHYLDRHHAEPRYPLAAAQADYLAQPRILAMAAHNALPRQSVPLPTAAVEAFQAGYATYLNLAWLAAAPADWFAPLTGDPLAAVRGRLADQLRYLTAANAHLARLHPTTRLVAVAFHAPASRTTGRPSDARSLAAGSCA
jgi:hypothetical protein